MTLARSTSRRLAALYMTVLAAGAMALVGCSGGGSSPSKAAAIAGAGGATGGTAGGAGPEAGAAGTAMSAAGSGLSEGGSAVGAAGSGVSEGGSMLGAAGRGVSEGGAGVAAAGAAGAGADFDLGPLSFQRDDTRAETSLVDETGGYISVTDATGVTWTLSIPEQIGLFPISVTVTPLKKLKAGADAPALQSGVLFEPEGLVFSDAATLRVTLPEVNESVAFFSFKGDGSEVELAEMTEHSSSFTLPVWHFSGKAVANGASSQKLCSLAQKQWTAAKRRMDSIFELPDSVPTPPKLDLRCANLDGKNQARQQAVDDYVWKLMEPERSALERGAGAAARACSCGQPACNEWPKDRLELVNRLGTKVMMIYEWPMEEAEYQFPIVSATYKLLGRLKALGEDVSDAGVDDLLLARLYSAAEELLRRVRDEHDYQQAQGYDFLTNEYMRLGGELDRADLAAALAAALRFQVNLDVNLFQDAPSLTTDEGDCIPGDTGSVTLTGTADCHYDTATRTFLPKQIEYRFTEGTRDVGPFIAASGCGYTSHCDMEAGARQTTPFQLAVSSCIAEKSRIVLSAVGGDETWHCAIHYPQAPEDDFTNDSDGFAILYFVQAFGEFYDEDSDAYILSVPMQNGKKTPIDLTFLAGSGTLSTTGDLHVRVVHTPG